MKSSCYFYPLSLLSFETNIIQTLRVSYFLLLIVIVILVDDAPGAQLLSSSAANI